MDYRKKVGSVEFSYRYGFSIAFVPKFEQMLNDIEATDKEAYYDMWQEIKDSSPVAIEEYGADTVAFDAAYEDTDDDGWTEGDIVKIPGEIHRARTVIAEVVTKTHKEVCHD